MSICHIKRLGNPSTYEITGFEPMSVGVGVSSLCDKGEEGGVVTVPTGDFGVKICFSEYENSLRVTAPHSVS